MSESDQPRLISRPLYSHAGPPQQDIESYVGIDDIQRVVPRAAISPVSEPPENTSRLAQRLSMARMLRGGPSKEVIVFGSPKVGIFGDMRTNNSSYDRVQVHIDHPVHKEVVEEMWAARLYEVAYIGYREGGLPSNVTIIPKDYEREIPTQEGKIAKIHELLNRELALKNAGKELKPASPSLIIPAESFQRMLGVRVSHLRLVPLDEQTPTQKALLLLLNTLYGEIAEKEQDAILSLFDTIGISEFLNGLDTTIIMEHTREDQQAHGLPAREISRRFPQDVDALLDLTLTRLRSRSVLWAKQNPLRMDLSGDKVRFADDMQSDEPSIWHEVNFGERFTMSLTEQYGYSYVVDKVTDPRPNGREKIHIAVSIDGKFAYRLAFPAAIDVEEVGKMITDRPTPFYSLSKAVEYSRSPLRNIVL